MLPTKSPRSAAPILRRRLVLSLRAVMSRAEVLPTLRIVALNLHIWIAEANDDNLASRILNVDGTLLPLAGSVERLVERHLLAMVAITFLGEGGFHRSRFCSSSMSGDSSPSVAATA